MSTKDNPICTRLYRLHIALADHPNDEEKQILQCYGKMQATISRDLVVPADITLHALHYAIQRAFGWQNCHLHHFALDPSGAQDKLNALAEGRFLKWSKLCGLYFRCPAGTSEEEMQDLYWDDDYREWESPKVWMRKKYTGPYRYGGKSEHYLTAQPAVQQLIKENPELRVPPSFAEFVEAKEHGTDREELIVPVEELTLEAAARVFESNPGELLERLRLDEVLITGKERADPATVYVTAERLAANAKANAELLRAWELAHQALEQNVRLRGAVYSAKRADLLWSERYWDSGTAREEAEQKVKALYAESDLHMQPLTDTLYYAYDYGDGWELAITCTDVFTVELQIEDGTVLPTAAKAAETARIANCIVKDRSGSSVVEQSRECVARAAVRHTVQCIALDGLPLMDDVGGLYGYIEFLQTWKEGDREEARDVMDWAKGQGWTGKPSKPENLL